MPTNLKKEHPMEGGGKIIEIIDENGETKEFVFYDKDGNFSGKQTYDSEAGGLIESDYNEKNKLIKTTDLFPPEKRAETEEAAKKIINNLTDEEREAMKRSFGISDKPKDEA